MSSKVQIKEVKLVEIIIRMLTFSKWGEEFTLFIRGQSYEDTIELAESFNPVWKCA